jgi:hypothetical protein
MSLTLTTSISTPQLAATSRERASTFFAVGAAGTQYLDGFYMSYWGARWRFRLLAEEQKKTDPVRPQEPRTGLGHQTRTVIRAPSLV